ncbi:hypothetical protein CWI36_0072p0020 [Hamiltosporidium magnivora]|uniref:Uncharacterized protein n=1 Tax=Hamiltosporidium magnivora TaxID=148818 RepID=A0A4Q9LNF7_9MICR|nr:hypothetical protein CWI36_0072p0020 [Hamiltosporidium magnivora]
MLPYEVNELSSVLSYYIEYVKIHTNFFHHKFLTRFICLIVCLIPQRDPPYLIRYKTELLANIISFAKLYEYSRCNKEMNDVEKTRMVSLFKTRLKTSEHREYICRKPGIRPDKIDSDCPLIIKNIESSFYHSSNIDN